MLSLLLFGSTLTIAVLAYYFQPARFILAAISMILHGLSAGILFSGNGNAWGFLFLIVSSFQILNIARLVDGRLHSKYLKNAFFIGGARLLILQLALLVLQRFDPVILLSSAFPIIVQTLVSLGILIIVVRQAIISRPKHARHFLSDHELPSISVLVPARNEDKNLEELLKTLLANDYPKLEVLVLDDCSADKNISDIVKQFAHDGVRFVRGDAPKINWLAKNQAYETLVSQASGDWLVFVGVDVRLGVGSLRGIVHYAINNEKSMLSVLPSRTSAAFWTGLFSPLRYFREFIKPSLFGSSVPALSTAWIIKKATYFSLGGIESVARKVIPEHYFANRLNDTGQYAFIRTNDYLQVATSKSLYEQIATSVRVIYPSLHRQMEQLLLSSAAMFTFLFLPYLTLAISIYNGEILSAFLSGLAVVFLSASHLVIVGITNPVLWPFAVINFPYLVLQEIILGIISMCKYEFGEIDWKGRNVCLPVMHVVPRLPSIREKA